MHVDPELLSLLALGEQVGSEADRAHLRTCRECAGELSVLQRVVTLGRGADTRLALPGQEVWARICAELAFDVIPESPEHQVVEVSVEALEPLSVTPSVDAAAAVGSGDEVRAHAELGPVEPYWSDASGRAELATDEHGRRLLQVVLRADLPTSGVRQAWLVDRDDATQRQTLGILDGRYGLWTVAHSIDLVQYSVLDISQQGTGETEHSGQTIVRGEFTLIS